MLKVPTAKRHHYIAKMHQKNFADANRKLFVFDSKCPQKGIEKRDLGNLFVEGHLYSKVLPDGSKDSCVEAELANLEGRVKPLIDKFIAAAQSNKSPELQHTEIEDWLIYFYLQTVRGPEAMHKKVNQNILPEILIKAQQEFSWLPGIEAMLNDENLMKRVIKNAKVIRLSKQSKEILELLRSRGIVLAKIVTNHKTFILGSKPVVRMGSKDLYNTDTELWLPITPTVAVGIGKGQPYIPIHKVSNTCAIREINLEIAKQSRIIASCSKELIRSLASHLGHQTLKKK